MKKVIIRQHIIKHLKDDINNKVFAYFIFVCLIITFLFHKYVKIPC